MFCRFHKSHRLTKAVAINPELEELVEWINLFLDLK